MRFTNHYLSVGAGALICAISGSAVAQAPEIGGLLPAGGLRGVTTMVRIDGKNLAGANLHLSGEGVSIKSMQVAKGGDGITVDLAVEPGADLGPREVRVTTTKGVSNGARFFVDFRPNRVVEQPMSEGTPPLQINGDAREVINSRIPAKAGRDRFLIDAKAGDLWSFDCYADRIRSRFDPVMELIDADGVSRKLVESTWESDPHFCYRFEKAGRYTLIVRDSEYNGGSNYTYRLHAGRAPYLAGYEPRGALPGSVVTLKLEGVGLPAPAVEITTPKSANLGTAWVEAKIGDWSTIVPILLENAPTTTVRELSPPTISAFPEALDGVFESRSSERFAFHAKKGVGYVFDLLGRRIGSRIDGDIRVYGAAGAPIAENDDAPGLGKDARLEFHPPADGDYTVEVSNVEEKTGPDCYYRLEARTIEPDFEIAIDADKYAIPRAGTIDINVDVRRVGGWDGPVEIGVAGLPPGVTAAPCAVKPGGKSGDLKLTAAPGASLDASEIHVVGKAIIAGKPAVREAPAWERYEHRSIDLLLSVEFSYTRPHHLWDMLLLQVTPAAPPAKK